MIFFAPRFLSQNIWRRNGDHGDISVEDMVSFRGDESDIKGSSGSNFCDDRDISYHGDHGDIIATFRFDCDSRYHCQIQNSNFACVFRDFAWFICGKILQTIGIGPY